MTRVAGTQHILQTFVHFYNVAGARCNIGGKMIYVALSSTKTAHSVEIFWKFVACKKYFTEHNDISAFWCFFVPFMLSRIFWQFIQNFGHENRHLSRKLPSRIMSPGLWYCALLSTLWAANQRFMRCRFLQFWDTIRTRQGPSRALNMIFSEGQARIQHSSS